MVSQLRVGTKLVAEEIEDDVGAITTPIYQTTAFAFPKGEKYRYSRESNPTVIRLNKLIAEAEGAQAGVSFSSGMGAISSTLLSLLRPGSTLVIQRDMFGRSFKFASDFLRSWGVNVRVAEPGNEDLLNKIEQGADMVFVESITNPLLRVADLEEISKICKEKGSLLVVDSTFATPINQTPLSLGADIVIHSASKYLAGHNDVIAGLSAGGEDHISRVDLMRRTLGTSLDPHAAYLVIRGMKTLKLRMETINRNTMEIAEFLQDHPRVSRVYYPGLSSHPDYEVALRVLRGFGGVVSFEVRGSQEDALSVIRRTKLIIPAQTLGGVNSVISHPATMSHRTLTPEERKLAGVTDNLLRLSIGIEDAEDLKSDLSTALSSL